MGVEDDISIDRFFTTPEGKIPPKVLRVVLSLALVGIVAGVAIPAFQHLATETSLAAEAAAIDPSFPSLTPEEVQAAKQLITGAAGTLVAKEISPACQQDPDMKDYLMAILEADWNYQVKGDHNLLIEDLGSQNSLFQKLDQKGCFQDAGGFFRAIATLINDLYESLSSRTIRGLDPNQTWILVETIAKSILKLP